MEVRRCEEELSNSKAEAETAQKEKHDKVIVGVQYLDSRCKVMS